MPSETPEIRSQIERLVLPITSCMISLTCSGGRMPESSRSTSLAVPKSEVPEENSSANSSITVSSSAALTTPRSAAAREMRLSSGGSKRPIRRRAISGSRASIRAATLSAPSSSRGLGRVAS